MPCSLVRHLERETIAEEPVLIWLPDLSQAALNAVANGVHRRLAAEGALYLAAAPFAVSSSEPRTQRSKRFGRSRCGGRRLRRVSERLRHACLGKR